MSGIVTLNVLDVAFQVNARRALAKSDQSNTRFDAPLLNALPETHESPEIIHVVSYSEAQFLANPKVINESIKITKAALKHYPEFRNKNDIFDLIRSKDLEAQSEELIEGTRILIKDMETKINNLYTDEGLYTVFLMGYFPVPFLWECREEFSKAIDWTTKIIGGGVHVAIDMGVPFLGKIPLDPQISAAMDAGTPFIAVQPDSSAAKSFNTIVEKIEKFTEEK